MAEITKLSVRVIEALESGRVSALPQGLYRRAIIRSVAREVGLQPEQTLREFSSAYPDELPSSETDVVVPTPTSRRSPQRAIAIAGAILPLLAGLAYFAWPASVAVEIAPVDLLVPKRTTNRLPPEIVPAGGFSEAAPTPQPRPVVVTLTISSACQLRVVADGKVLTGRAMEQGETMVVELGEELVLVGDNAAAVQFSINGQAGRALGGAGDALSARIGRDDYKELLVRY